MSFSVSVVVRTKNEEKTVGKTLKLLQSQTVKPLEIILVDNESTDSTVNIAKKSGCKIVNIQKSQFNHAKSCNLGAEKAQGELIIFTNGHAFPISNRWIESGIKHFKNKKVAGVYGVQKGDERESFWEKIVGNFYRIVFKPERLVVQNKISFLKTVGLMCTVNCILRKSLWEKRQYLEEISLKANGGEDIEWGYYHIKKGYLIVEEPRFNVYHCHGDSLSKLITRVYNYIFMTLYVNFLFKLQKTMDF